LAKRGDDSQRRFMLFCYKDIHVVSIMQNKNHFIDPLTTRMSAAPAVAQKINGYSYASFVLFLCGHRRTFDSFAWSQ
jgi:hypothetical protein